MIKKLLKALLTRLGALGFSPYPFFQLVNIPKYVSQYRQYRKLGGRITSTYMILSDYKSKAGVAKGHYFHQDLLVASFIHDQQPSRHIDVGSRIDGFVAHVATFRSIEVIDVRALDDCGHENIRFIQADLMDETAKRVGTADSVSCLHALEHFGLGRYGDPIDPDGHIKGFNNILDLLNKGGRLYVSFPIGRSNEVHFNAHRVFHPKDIFNWIKDGVTLTLERFDYVDDAGRLHGDVDLGQGELDVTFGCGIYSFVKS